MDVFGARKIYFGFSILLMVVGIGFLAAGIIKPGSTLKPGIDFTGGSVLQLRPRAHPDLAQIRAALSNAGYKDATPLYAVDARLGNILTVRTPIHDPNELKKLQ